MKIFPGTIIYIGGHLCMALSNPLAGDYPFQGFRLLTESEIKDWDSKFLPERCILEDLLYAHI